MKIGIIGTGKVASDAYLPFLAKQPDVELYYWNRTREKAKSCAAHAIDGRDGDPLPRLLELTGGRGVDAAIEAAGIPLTAKQCFKAVRTAGTVVFNGEQPSVNLSPSEDFIRRDIRAIGSWFFHVGEFPDMLRWWRDGLPVADLVTHVFPLTEASRAFAAFTDGRTGKVLLRYES